MDKELYEACCFKIIAAAGSAKSCYLEAIEQAKNDENYEVSITEGEKAFYTASEAHAEALKYDALGKLDCGLLLIHAETILSSAETIKDLSETLIALIRK